MWIDKFTTCFANPSHQAQRMQCLLFANIMSFMIEYMLTVTPEEMASLLQEPILRPSVLSDHLFPVCIILQRYFFSSVSTRTSNWYCVVKSCSLWALKASKSLFNSFEEQAVNDAVIIGCCCQLISYPAPTVCILRMYSNLLIVINSLVMWFVKFVSFLCSRVAIGFPGDSTWSGMCHEFSASFHLQKG